MGQKKSPTAIGDEREEAFRDMRIRQGYLSQKRNRAKFKANDLWLFDVFSMKGNVMELAQVKGPEPRGEQTVIKKWIEENRSNIPHNVRILVAYDKRENDKFRGDFRLVVLKEARHEP